MKKFIWMFVVLCLGFYTNINFAISDSMNIPIGSVSFNINKLYVNYSLDSHKVFRNTLVPQSVRDTSIIGQDPGKRFPGFNRNDSLGSSDSNIVDWVAARIINAADSSKYYWLSGVLTTEGTVVRPNDPEKRSLCFYSVIPGTYYLEVVHGKSIPVFYATPFVINGFQSVFDTYWNKPENIYQSFSRRPIIWRRSTPLKYYEGDIWGLISGDVNGDLWVDLQDWLIINNNISPLLRYRLPDIDGNNIVSWVDREIMVDNWWSTIQSPFVTDTRGIEIFGPDNFSSFTFPYGLYAKGFVRDSSNVVTFQVSLKGKFLPEVGKFDVGQLVIKFDSSFLKGQGSVSVIEPATEIATVSLYRNEIRLLLMEPDGLVIDSEKVLCKIRLRTDSVFSGTGNFQWRNTGPGPTAIAILRNDSLIDITEPTNHYVEGLTGITSFNQFEPNEYKLEQNYPNPFNPVTKISYTVPQGLVNLTVYDLTGKVVYQIVNEKKNSGTYTEDFNGISLSSGVYFYKLSVGNFTATKKMILIK